jgi:hypothetical protein
MVNLEVISINVKTTKVDHSRNKINKWNKQKWTKYRTLRNTIFNTLDRRILIIRPHTLRSCDGEGLELPPTFNLGDNCLFLTLSNRRGGIFKICATHSFTIKWQICSNMNSTMIKQHKPLGQCCQPLLSCNVTSGSTSLNFIALFRFIADGHRTGL